MASGNFCVWNAVTKNSYGTLSQGNLKLLGSSGSGGQRALSSFGLTSGKWYMEFRVIDAGNNYPRIGLSLGSAFDSANLSGDGYQAVFLFEAGSQNNGSNCKNANDSTGRGKFGTVSYTNTGVSGGSNIFGFALDLDNRKLFISKDGTYFNSGDPANGTNPQIAWTTTPSEFIHLWGDAYQTITQIIANWGQDSTFSGNETAGGNSDGNFGDFKYAPPSGFLAICSGNLPISDDIDPAQTDDDFPSKLFNVVTYTGNGGTNAISNVNFQPDLVWLKKTSGSASHQLYDSSRGTGKLISSNTTDAEQTVSTGVNSFDSDGFTLGSAGGVNANGGTFVAWCWKVNGGTTASNTSGDINSTVQVNDKAGMSIVQYTGNGSQNQTIGHGLTKAPEMVWMKNLSNSNVGGIAMDWIVALSTSTGSPFARLSGSAQTLELNENKVLSGKYRTEGNFTPTTSTFNVPNNGNAPYWFNANANNYIAYCWHSVEGFSQFGMYTANGNSDGPFIYTGFKPRLIFCKTTAQADSWIVHDTKRNTYNPSDKIVFWDTNEAQASGSSFYVDVLANGFKVRSTNALLNNTSADPYVYGCWSDVSFKYNNTF